MSRSLNEVSALAKKAARGAGYSWGMAEEAGWAVWWLCRQGIDGAGFLAAFLRDEAHTAPVYEAGQWRLASGALCPIYAGVALSDGAGLPDVPAERFGKVACPALLLPFLSTLAKVRSTTVEVKTAGGEAMVTGAAVQLAPEWGKRCGPVELSFSNVAVPIKTHNSRAHSPESTWKELEEFAAKTYAPATEASRQKGAGAVGVAGASKA